MEDSQPSQLLRDVLCGGAEPGGKSIDTDPSLSDLVIPKIVSPESSHDSARNSGSAPRYHYYGLAQTQSQQHDDCADNEHSQKENFGSSIGSRSTPSNAPSSKSPIKEQTTPGGQLNHTLPRAAGIKPKTSTTKAATYQSSGATASSHRIDPTPAGRKALPTHSPPHSSAHQQTVEEFSQDSFAGHLPQDRAREFLAHSKLFEVPLSELGRYTQETRTAGPPDVPDQPSSDIDIFVSPHRRNVGRIADASFIQGKVLVEDTPSNSAGSESQPSQPSQQLESPNPNLFLKRQPDVNIDEPGHRDDDALSQASTEACSTPSSSYERLLAGEPEPVRDAATQPAEDFQPTQPSTQPDHYPDVVHTESGGKAEWGTGVTNTIHQWVSPAARATSTTQSTTRRTVAGMINPRKRWRIKDLEKFEASATNPPLRVNEEMHEGTTEVSRLDARSRYGMAVPARNRVQASGDDTMDTVPDSESPLGDPELVSARSTVLVPPTDASALVPMRRDRHIVPDVDSMETVEDSILVRGGDEDEDENGPLAIITSKRVPMMTVSEARTSERKPSGKIPAEGREPAKVVEVVTTTSHQKRPYPGVGTTVKDPRKRSRATAPSNRSWQNDVVPSSIPGEDENNAPANPQSTNEHKIQSDAPAAPTAVPPGRSTGSKPAAVSSKKGHLLTESARTDTSFISRKAEEEEETDVTGEDYMVLDVDEDDSPGPSSRKRRRGNIKAKTNVKRYKPASRASSRMGKVIDSAPTKTDIKRLRSCASASTSRSVTGAGTRVFALWKQDGHFYPGTVHSLQSRSKYRVKFDDGTEDEVDISRMRLNGLRAGDNIILMDTNETATVVDDTRIEFDGTIEVEFYNGKELQRMDVEIACVRIAARTISSKWEDRLLTPDCIVTTIRPKVLKHTPSLSRLSITSSISNNDYRRKSLLKTGIAITLTPKYGNQQGDRAKLVKIIKSNGGTVIDDWFSLIRMEGDFSRSNKQWVAHAKDVKWIGKQSIQRIFLVANDFSAKPKYLVALALGIPCLSLEWLLDSAKSGERDWQPYLLPQGTSIALNARVSQFVDLDWCNSAEHLVEIMSKNNKVASRLFDGKSILCLGAAFVPESKRKKIVSDSDMTKEASGTVPRIILAMGAARVEAVIDVQYASDRPSGFDYVVAQDPLPDLGMGVDVVNVEWIKDCLVSRKLTKLPGEESDD